MPIAAAAATVPPPYGQITYYACQSCVRSNHQALAFPLAQPLQCGSAVITPLGFLKIFLQRLRFFLNPKWRIAPILTIERSRYLMMQNESDKRIGRPPSWIYELKF